MPEVSVSVIGRTIQVACEDAEYAATRNAANYLNGELKKIPEENEAFGSSTVLLLAGLNMADRILTMSKDSSSDNGSKRADLFPSPQSSQKRLDALKAVAELAESIADRLEARLGSDAGAGTGREPIGSRIET